MASNLIAMASNLVASSYCMFPPAKSGLTSGTARVFRPHRSFDVPMKDAKVGAQLGVVLNAWPAKMMKMREALNQLEDSNTK